MCNYRAITTLTLLKEIFLIRKFKDCYKTFMDFAKHLEFCFFWKYFEMEMFDSTFF